MTTLDDWLKKRPVNRDAVDAHKARMRGEVRAHALRELREAQDLPKPNWLACCTLAKTASVPWNAVRSNTLRSTPCAATSMPSAASSASKLISATNASKSPNGTTVATRRSPGAAKRNRTPDDQTPVVPRVCQDKQTQPDKPWTGWDTNESLSWAFQGRDGTA